MEAVRAAVEKGGREEPAEGGGVTCGSRAGRETKTLGTAGGRAV